MKTTLQALLAVALLLLLPSCNSGLTYAGAVSGQYVKAVPNKSLVIVYWSGTAFTTNLGKFKLSASTPDDVSEQLLTSGLEKGRFYTLQTTPGDVRIKARHTFTAASIMNGLVNTVYQMPLSFRPQPGVISMWSSDTISLKTDPGKIYFVHACWPLIEDRLRLKQVSESEAWPEIYNCRWLNPHP